jgi:phosphoenolpyruvate carboxykinase (ATP)
MVRAALNGELDDIPTRIDPNFGVTIPEHIPGVPSEILNPRQTWADTEAYDRQARLLIDKFKQSFSEFAGEVDQKIADAGPK